MAPDTRKFAEISPFRAGSYYYCKATVYLIGFEKMVSIVSSIGPVVILFVIFVAGYSVVRDVGQWHTIAAQSKALASFKAAPHWSISAFLYLSLNFLSGSVYYSALGRSAYSRRSVKLGAVIGAVAVVLTITLMSIAILCNGTDISAVSVPTLFLAEKISRIFGSIFSVILLLGMFSSCCTMLWSFCSGFFKKDRVKNKIFSVFTVIGCLLLGLVPFGKLVSVIYPIIGYFGILFVFAVFYRPLRHKRR